MAEHWQGWRPLPAPPVAAGAGPWVELSHPLGPDLARIPFFPALRFSRLMSMPA